MAQALGAVFMRVLGGGRQADMFVVMMASVVVVDARDGRRAAAVGCCSTAQFPTG